MGMTKTLCIRVDGIYCEHCVETIKLALRSLDGVESAEIRQNVVEISGENLPSKEVNVIEFTPTEAGDYVYTCWMNMISNRIKVINDIDYFK